MYLISNINVLFKGNLNARYFIRILYIFFIHSQSGLVHLSCHQDSGSQQLKSLVWDSGEGQSRIAAFHTRQNGSGHPGINILVGTCTFIAGRISRNQLHSHVLQSPWKWHVMTVWTFTLMVKGFHTAATGNTSAQFRFLLVPRWLDSSAETNTGYVV